MHFLIGVVFVIFAQGPFGELWNKKSILTTERQVEFPGIVLEPGTYVIRLLTNGEKRSLVQILNSAEDQVLSTILAVPDHRMRPQDGDDFSYHRAGDSEPRPVQAWYYTGDLVGLEFVYPTARAKELAKASDAHVMASNNKEGVIVAVTPNGKEIVVDEPLQTARQKPK